MDSQPQIKNAYLYMFYNPVFFKKSLPVSSHMYKMQYDVLDRTLDLAVLMLSGFYKMSSATE